MAQIIQVILRSVQLLLTILVTGLIGHTIASAFSGNPGAINFAMFVAVISWVAVIYGLVTAFVESLVMPIANLRAQSIVQRNAWLPD